MVLCQVPSERDIGKDVAVCQRFEGAVEVMQVCRGTVVGVVEACGQGEVDGGVAEGVGSNAPGRAGADGGCDGRHLGVGVGIEAAVGIEGVDQHRVAAVCKRRKALCHQVGLGLGRPVPHRADEAPEGDDGPPRGQGAGVGGVSHPLEAVVSEGLNEDLVVDVHVAFGPLANPFDLAAFRDRRCG